MPSVIQKIEDPKEGAQSPLSAMREMRKEIKELKQGQGAVGYIGDPPPSLQFKPQPAPETAIDRADRKKIVPFLMAVLTPNKLRPTSTEKEERLSLSGKLNKADIATLRLFLPQGLDIATLDAKSCAEDLQDEIQRRYQDISP